MRIRLVSIVMALLMVLVAKAEIIRYTADDTSIFPNPERGFTEEIGGETRLSDSKNHVVLAEEQDFFDETNAERANQTLVVTMYYLYNYMSKDLSDKVLQGFDEDLQILRNHGFKCVLRFAYDWKSKNDADLDHVKRHIAQLKPYLAKNKDVIYVLEAGFVGQWGEWYYSQHFTNKTQQLTADRRKVLEALLDACPEGRFLLVRYPLIKLSYLGDEHPLTASQAYDGSARAKIGHHNDAFLNNWGNDGTYGRDGDGLDDDPVLRQYIADETLYVPNGGETNVEDNKDTPGLPEKVYAKAEEEMSRYHWSFCGSTYSEEVTDRWRTSGIFDNLNRKMGYRYQLIQANLPQAAEAGAQARFQITLRNVGYAPLYNERKAYIVLSNQQSVFSIPLQSDPRRWLPNGAETQIDEVLTIPTEVPNGTYELYLHLPDAAQTLASDPRYAVRFANVGTWDATTGMNRLNATITIGSKPGEGLDPVPSTATQSSKVLRNGQLLILRGDKIYDVMGNEIHSFNEQY